MFKPDDVETDAALMQYKSGGDEGRDRQAPGCDVVESDRCRAKSSSGKRTTGAAWSLTGTSASGWPRRLSAEGQDIDLPALVSPGADGISAAQARVLGALAEHQSRHRLS
jgi:hypothetical protein